MIATAWSLLPPLVALVSALSTRRVLPSLAAGGLCGALLLALEHEPAPVALPLGVIHFVQVGILGRVSEPANAQVLVLIALISGFVRALEVSGAARGLTSSLTAIATSPARAQLATWLSGLLLFFSDLGNILILGPLFRPLYDRMDLPRERLAWIIDTTAAPVSVMIPVISWGVYIIGLIEATEEGADGLQIFLDALPFQIYPLLSLLFVPLMVIIGRPWGPMARVWPRPDVVDTRPRAAPDGLGPGAALVPLGLLFVVGLGVGLHQLALEGQLTGAGIRLSLASAYLAALLALLAILAPHGRSRRAIDAFQEGLGRATPLVVLLIFAWTLGEVCSGLGTGPYLARLLGPRVPAPLLPALVFGIGAIISFATGTSWGTFAILVPLALPLAMDLQLPVPVIVGAVLSGGVLGDHCSPISDTSLLASASAGSAHGAHIATQLPYALAVGLASLLAFGIAGATGSAWSLGSGAVVLLGVALASRWIRAHDPTGGDAATGDERGRRPDAHG
ncbi:MAG TPA: hypothetical protein ENK18_01420 [Deltaproteobacteria bacterium]|nr:hypothetical protein [Deltaproteobacteria bacterium]